MIPLLAAHLSNLPFRMPCSINHFYVLSGLGYLSYHADFAPYYNNYIHLASDAVYFSASINVSLYHPIVIRGASPIAVSPSPSPGPQRTATTELLQ